MRGLAGGRSRFVLRFHVLRFHVLWFHVLRFKVLRCDVLGLHARGFQVGHIVVTGFGVAGIRIGGIFILAGGRTHPVDRLLLLVASRSSSGWRKEIILGDGWPGIFPRHGGGTRFRRRPLMAL